MIDFMNEFGRFSIEHPRIEIRKSAENETRLTLGIPLDGPIPAEMQDAFKKQYDELMNDSDFNPYTKENQKNAFWSDL